MTSNISDKDQKDWKNFLDKNEKLPNKDLEKKENKFHITKSLDLHGYTLDEANKKVESFIIECFDQKISKVIIVTGKGLHSQNDKDPYISKKFGILKNSVPDFIKNNHSLFKSPDVIKLTIIYSIILIAAHNNYWLSIVRCFKKELKLYEFQIVLSLHLYLMSMSVYKTVGIHNCFVNLL